MTLEFQKQSLGESSETVKDLLKKANSDMDIIMSDTFEVWGEALDEKYAHPMQVPVAISQIYITAVLSKFMEVHKSSMEIIPDKKEVKAVSLKVLEATRFLIESMEENIKNG